MNIKLMTTAFLMTAACWTAVAQRPTRRTTEGAKLHRFSTTVEKERPQLSEETKRLISAYRGSES